MPASAADGRSAARGAAALVRSAAGSPNRRARGGKQIHHDVRYWGAGSRRLDQFCWSGLVVSGRAHVGFIPLAASTLAAKWLRNTSITRFVDLLALPPRNSQAVGLSSLRIVWQAPEVIGVSIRSLAHGLEPQGHFMTSRVASSAFAAARQRTSQCDRLDSLDLEIAAGSLIPRRTDRAVGTGLCCQRRRSCSVGVRRPPEGASGGVGLGLSAFQLLRDRRGPGGGFPAFFPSTGPRQSFSSTSCSITLFFGPAAVSLGCASAPGSRSREGAGAGSSQPFKQCGRFYDCSLRSRASPGWSAATGRVVRSSPAAVSPALVELSAATRGPGPV